MKTVFSVILFAIILSSTFSINGCVKDLPRDNPLDSLNNTGTYKGIRELNFSSYQITGQYAFGSGGIYTTNTTVNPGDSSFLEINMINAGNVTLYGIKMSISSTSNLIQIVSLQSGYYIECTGDISSDSLSAGQIGYTTITNGTFFTDDPNSNSYAINFKVSNSAQAGNQIPFIIQTTDNAGDKWTASFNITLN